MDTILELCIVVVPVIISRLFSFLITKYTYNKNVPRDKFEISYNRVTLSVSIFLTLTSLAALQPSWYRNKP